LPDCAVAGEDADETSPVPVDAGCGTSCADAEKTGNAKSAPTIAVMTIVDFMMDFPRVVD
jgi:hypothetical protein